MIWTCEEVFAVERMQASMRVNEDALTAGGDSYRIFIAQELHAELSRNAQEMGLKLDIQDLHFKWDRKEFDEYSMAILRARWEPETKTVILMNGPLDGKTYTISAEILRRGPLKVIHSTTPPWREIKSDDTFPRVDLREDVVDYEWSGWHETERIWTYATAKK